MSDVAAYHVFVCALFPVQGGMWTAVLPVLETTDIAHNNELFIILTRDFSKEQ